MYVFRSVVKNSPEEANSTETKFKTPPKVPSTFTRQRFVVPMTPPVLRITSEVLLT